MPGVMGGVESHCEQLLPRLRKRRPGDEIEILVRKPYTKARPYRYGGMRVVPLPAWRSKYLEAAFGTIAALIYARFVFRADVLHIHAIGPALFTPVARLLGLRVVVTHHGRDFDRERWNWFARSVLKLGEWCGCTFANRVIAVSPSLSADLHNRFARRSGNIVYIPNGATLLPSIPEAASRDLIRRLGLEPGRYIISAGRFVPEKGFDDVIEAFRRWSGGMSLVIAGRADHEDEYSRALRAQATESIIFPGYQNPAALRTLYENASLFVLASRHEGLPIAVLEAIGAGAPVLLSDIPANRDVGLPGKNYFPVRDVAELARKLAQPHEAFAVDGPQVIARFNWDAAADATAEVLADLEAEIERSALRRPRRRRQEGRPAASRAPPS